MITACEWSNMFPSIGPFCETDIDKDKLQLFLNRYFLNRFMSMFKYDGLPEVMNVDGQAQKLPQKYIELYLMTTGMVGFTKDDNGDLTAVYGNLGGDPNVYYRPKTFLWANPYIKKVSKHEFEIGKDVEIIFNDSLMCGLMPLLNKYTSLMVENYLTAKIELISLRAMSGLTAPDDKSLASAQKFISDLINGKISVMADSNFLDGIKALSLRNSQTNNITSIIEMQQYLKAGLYNELGLNANWNAKRESISANENQLNDDQLTPLIDNMLTERKEGVERVNKLFGTNITVDFNSAWKENEEEKDLIKDKMESEAAGDKAEKIEEEIKTDSIENEKEKEEADNNDNGET